MISFKYNWTDARKDVLAGLTVAAVAVPQAMAYALIAGVDPRFGLYSAVVVTAVASVFGSSSHLINGPTNAISLVVFSAISFIDPDARYDAFQAMFLLAAMAGAIQILVAVFRLGDLTRYVSESVVLGFMAGAGVLVAVGQVSNLLGIRERGTGHQHLLVRLWHTLTEGGLPNPRALAIGLGTIVIIVVLRRLMQRYRLPKVDMLLALIAVSLVAAALGWSEPGPDGRTALAIVGNVPASLPEPHVPEIRFWWVTEMSGSALAIAFLGLMEALAVAKAIAHSTGQQLDYNKQCLAEGLGNLVGGFFQCLPGSGSLTRSAINFQAGAVSRVSGVVAAVAVAVLVLVFAPLARHIPKAALSGLLFVVAARLIDLRRLRYAFQASRYDAGLVLTTALSAVFVSVEFSILIGVAISILMFVPRAARLRTWELVVSGERVVRERMPWDPHCNAMILWGIEGELFFGAAPELERCFDGLRRRAEAERIRIIVLRLKRTRNPDMVCIERLEHFLKDMQHR
ncbi:MAG: SulP family inorganic anion transporter, partial [Acetobacteraceae bacterium]|nr:SulP family inorganic anion transporter [Acetobacteraceae bacterium]